MLSAVCNRSKAFLYSAKTTGSLYSHISKYQVLQSYNMHQTTKKGYYSGKNELKQAIARNQVKKAIHMIEEMKYSQEDLPSELAGSLCDKCRSAEVAKELVDLFRSKKTIPSDQFVLKETLLMLIKCNMYYEASSLHSVILKNTNSSNCSVLSTFVQNKLIELYAGAGNTSMIENIFEQMKEQQTMNEYTYTTLMNSLTKNNQPKLALEYFNKILDLNIKPDTFLLCAALAAAAGTKEMKIGRNIQRMIVEHQIPGSARLRKHIIEMLTSCGETEEAQSVFQLMQKENQVDVISYNIMIKNFVLKSEFQNAIDLFHSMIKSPAEPNARTFVAVLSAVSGAQDIETGKYIHQIMDSKGIEESTILRSQLMDMYGKCGDTKTAFQIFQSMIDSNQVDVISYNMMIKIFTLMKDYQAAIDLFHTMIENSHFAPNARTFVAVLSAAAGAQDIETGKYIHELIEENNVKYSPIIINQLMDMYGSCGEIDTSLEWFQVLKDSNQLDVGSWNMMIKHLAQHEEYQRTIEFFQSMINSGMNPDESTFTRIMSAIIKNGAYEKGIEIHQMMEDLNVLQDNLLLQCKVMEFYGKFGMLDHAMRIFKDIQEKSKPTIECWTTIIHVHGFNGQGELSLKLFEQMIGEGECKPDEVTIQCVLNAFSHSGMIEEARSLFSRLETEFDISPTIEHHTCLVDVLARANLLEEAEKHIDDIQTSEDMKKVPMIALLGGCRKYSDYDRAMRIGKTLLRIDPTHVPTYVLLSHICSSNGLVDKAKEFLDQIPSRGLKKEPGISWTTIDNIPHTFRAHDDKHRDSAELFQANLAELKLLKQRGFVPNVHTLSQKLTSEEKEKHLCGHSERYAMQFAHKNLPPGKTIHITKNLRVCEDCHEYTLELSRLWQREIIFRDANRLHFIKDGKCSCNNYW